MSNFHFIRPYWFIAIIPVVFILWKMAKQHLINKHWESVCDPELLPYILVGKSDSKKHTDIVLTSIVSLLMIVALAGPTWERLPQPVFQKESALVIALDLSLSMYADDIKPSRLERARFKISDLLQLRKEGQTALLVYAGDAFTVTPLTDDVKTINSQLSALSPAIMPAPGSRTDIAITKATELLKQAGMSQGHILLVTDEVDEKFENIFLHANKEAYTISILGVGTEEGAPISLGNSGFLEDKAGTIVIPKLNEKVLRQLAAVGGGYYETSQITDSDVERLNRLFNRDLDSKEEKETEFKSDQWHEFGPWLVLLILPVVAFGFRRGYLVILVCITFTINPDDAMAFEWNDLWLNKNQKAMRALENDQADVASDLFQDNEWKAAAKYRSGDYVATEELLNELQDNRSLYNKANSLAKQGRYEEAINTYEEVLVNVPEHEDAKFNKALVEKELEKQQQQSSQDQNGDQNKNSEQNKENQTEQDQQQSQSENNQQQSDSESGQQSESESQNQEEKNSDAADPQQTNEEEKEQEQDMKQQQAEQSEEKQNKEEQQEQQQSQQATNELDEEQQAAEQWLRRIPDDPSGLLRRKFKYQYQQQRNRQPSTSEKYW
ncbi:MAG: VWA domain-containing protein [Proteobacteria bacterium]|nr:VWA domain-containing protein [Pseudomonadota bacterium]